MGEQGAKSLDLSVVILSWNTQDLSLACLEALARDRSRCEREVLILDNGSQDGSVEVLERFCSEHEGFRLLKSAENLGYAVGNNRAASEARGRYLCLLNSDTEVEEGALDQLVDFLEAKGGEVAVAPKLINPDGSTQHACKRIPGLGLALVYDFPWASWPLLRRIDAAYFYRDFDHESSRCVEQPPASCFALSRELWEGLGGFDEDLWLFYNDVDLCKRLAESGHAIHYLAEARVLHHEGASTRNFTRMVPVWAHNRIAYYRKHNGALGAILVRFLIRLRGWIEWRNLGRLYADPHERRAARKELSRVLAEALAR